MRDLPCTKEKLQKQKLGSHERAQKFTGTPNIQFWVWEDLLWLACWLTEVVVPSGESMFPPVPLRGTLTSLMIWRRPATRWPALLKFHMFATRKLWDLPKQQYSAMCFSFKGCIFLSQISPIVYCKCQASFPSLCDMVIGYCTNPNKG